MRIDIKKNFDTFPEFITFQSNQLCSFLLGAVDKTRLESINSLYQNNELSSLFNGKHSCHILKLHYELYICLITTYTKLNINALMIDNKNTA